MRDYPYLIMFTLITVSFSLFFIGLTGWGITTYLVKEDSQIFIQEELKNLLDISKMFFVSLRSLIGILVKYTSSSHSTEVTPAELNGLDKQPLRFVQPVKAVDVPSMEVPVKEDEDTELSSFSPELVEVITEEEEKVA